MVRDVMRTGFATAAPDEPIASALQTMRLARLRHLPVTQEGTLVGLVTYRDLVEELAGPRARSLACVADVMQRDPVSITPEASLEAAADPMYRYGLGCLPVVTTAGALVGLITECDLLRAAYGSRRP